MITVSYRFAHIFKIMRIPQPIIPLRSPSQPVQGFRSGRGCEIDVLYIRCLDSWVPECSELWYLAEDSVREVHPYARVRLLSEFREDNSHTHLLNCDDSRFLS